MPRDFRLAAHLTLTGGQLGSSLREQILIRLAACGAGVGLVHGFVEVALDEGYGTPRSLPVTSSAVVANSLATVMVVGQVDRRDHPSNGHQPVVIEGYVAAVEVLTS